MLDAVGFEQIIYYTFLVIILLISIWLHEYAHARTSYKLWDPTPVLQWRLTPNPFKHMDIVWFLAAFLIGFWWWKPVVNNPVYYKYPIKWDILVAFAWPAMNLVLAFFWMLIMMVYGKIIWIWIQDLLLGWDYVILFRQMFIIMNIAFAVFNMIPFPPLDGYRLIKIFWKKWAQRMEKNMMWFFAIFLLLMLYWSSIIWNYVFLVSDAIYRLFFMLFGLIF